ncbi:hypothetical protein EDC01DRAFT_708243 [Geopyxis carbonaria]|nr:hypothetical protein EDC01DRAFT_708243 [Geopyxis carbonaria]
MHTNALLLSALLWASTLASPLAAREAALDPSKVWIAEATYGGSGCPQGSTAPSLSADRTSIDFTLNTSEYVATLTDDIIESRKNCQLNVDLRVPAGWQYMVASSEFTGRVSISSGVEATQKATYYFAGDTEQVSTSTTFEGPVAKNYAVKRGSTEVWSPCGEVAALNVNSQVRLDGTGTGYIAGSINKTVTFNLGIKWRAC